MRNDFFTINLSWSEDDLCWKAEVFFKSTGSKETKIRSYEVWLVFFPFGYKSVSVEMFIESAGIEPALLEWKSKVLTVRR